MADEVRHELLRKLKQLADGGIGGEKINAQKMLAKYLAKHGITEAELDEEAKTTYEFKHSGEVEKRLLLQIMYKVTNSKEAYSYFATTRSGSRRRVKGSMGCDCTQAQRIEIEFLFDFYKRLYKKEIKYFLDAFIQKHGLFGKLQDGEEPQRLPTEELLKIMAMQSGMSDETPLRQLEGGGNGS